MSRFLALVFGCSLLPMVASVASAQDDTGLRMYGSGVHSYYARQYEDALKSFQLASDTGLNDPRCFYFRGLALLKLGKTAAAQTNFKKGAALEATNPALLPIVSEALQRVQGHVRVTIESLRAEARSDAIIARESQKQALYGNRQADVHDPISGQQPPPSADDPQLFGPGAADTLVADPVADDSSDLFPDDPVAETATAPADGETDDDKETPAQEGDDPFADDDPADDEGDDLFGDE